MISALNRLANGNVELTITVPWEKVKDSYGQVLENLAKKTEIKGFRKGKAPRGLVEKQVDKNKIYEEVLKILVPQVYSQAVKEQNLKPIIAPQLKVIAAGEEKDWQFQATTCEFPEVVLNDYQEEIRKALASDKIWVPGKDKKGKEPKSTEEERIGKIFKTLLQVSKLKIPEILVEGEINRMLSRLIDQTAKLGLTVEQYLASQKKTSEQLKAEYQQQAEELLKLELILSAIADKEEIQVTDKELEQLIQAVPDEQTRKNLESPEQQIYLRQLLRKRKVIDNLNKL